jgi:hypothetical protein
LDHGGSVRPELDVQHHLQGRSSHRPHP